MFGFLTSDFSLPNVQFTMRPPCLYVRPDVDMSPGLAGMYQVSPRHHYVCIFTNVKILHNMSGTDSGDTPSVHPEPRSLGT
mgnify:CR=1 FL=1